MILYTYDGTIYQETPRHQTLPDIRYRVVAGCARQAKTSNDAELFWAITQLSLRRSRYVSSEDHLPIETFTRIYSEDRAM